MAGVESKAFDSPDETRNPAKTMIEVVRLGGATAARMTMEPGWKWSECIKPVAGTESCQARHVGVVQSGRLHVTHDDGTELELGPGDAYVIEGVSGSYHAPLREREPLRIAFTLEHFWERDTDPQVKAPGSVYGGPVVDRGRLYVATCNLEGPLARQPTVVVCIGAD